MASGITVGAAVTVGGEQGEVKAIFANGRIRVQVGRRIVRTTLGAVKLVRATRKGKGKGKRAERPLLPCKAAGCRKHTVFVSKSGSQLCSRHRALAAAAAATA